LSKTFAGAAFVFWLCVSNVIRDCFILHVHQLIRSSDILPATGGVDELQRDCKSHKSCDLVACHHTSLYCVWFVVLRTACFWAPCHKHLPDVLPNLNPTEQYSLQRRVQFWGMKRRYELSDPELPLHRSSVDNWGKTWKEATSLVHSADDLLCFCYFSLYSCNLQFYLWSWMPFSLLGHAMKGRGPFGCRPGSSLGPVGARRSWD
jgi:hypothetical protein